MKRFNYMTLLAFCCSAPLWATSMQEPALSAPQSEDFLQQELEWLNAEAYSTTAFRFKDQINKSPGSITVVTAEEIKDMGARDIMDVLERVPGISVYRGAYNTRIQVRGILRTSSQDVLMMVNGFPVTNNYIGSGIWVYNSLSVEQLQRVEVVRGPASSLYGANAFSAIINVITKSAADIDGLEAHQSIGSNNHRKTLVQYGKIFESGLELTAFADFLETDGFSGTVEADRQTIFDGILGTNSSLAPGETNNRERKLHLGMNMKYEGFFIDTMWTDRVRGPNVGIFDALNESSALDQQDGFINLGYDWQVNRNLVITPNFYYHFNRMSNRIEYLPPGGLFFQNVNNPGAGVLAIPDGLESVYNVTNERKGFELRGDWRLQDNYRLAFGFNYEYMKQSDVSEDGNFYFLPNGDLVLNDGEKRVDKAYTFNRSADRTFKAFYVENLIDLTDTLRLTLGGRYDHYSDFGGTLNPRASVIWEFSPGWDLKLQYARAFRAPSFYELYNNQPFVMGNPTLDPEIIDSYEASISGQITRDLHVIATLFHNEIKGTIEEEHRPAMIQFENSERIRINGFELEGKYNLGRGSYLMANYTYQHSFNHDIQARVGKVPLQFAYAALNLRLSRTTQWYTSVNWSDAPNPRPEDDFKRFGESYTVVNTGLRFKDFLKALPKLEAGFYVYNLFDKEYFSDYSTEIPGGVPMPGRNYMFQLSCRF